MLIWLNGAFGAGKTSLAHEIQRLHPRVLIFDPEEIGFALRRAQTPRPGGDFQDDPLWRELVLVSLERLLAREVRPVVVPMTLVEPLYFEEIIGELRSSSGHDLHHFALIASKDTILDRLRSRGEFGNSFAAQNLDRCLNALHQEGFATQLQTDHVPLQTLARDVLNRVGLSVSEPPLEPDWKRAWRRWTLWWRSLRFD